MKNFGIPNHEKKDDPMDMGVLNPKGITDLKKLTETGIKEIWGDKIKSAQVGNLISNEISKSNQSKNSSK